MLMEILSRFQHIGKCLFREPPLRPLGRWGVPPEKALLLFEDPNAIYDHSYDPQQHQKQSKRKQPKQRYSNLSTTNSRALLYEQHN